LGIVFPGPKFHGVFVVQDVPVLRVAGQRSAAAVGNVAQVAQERAFVAFLDLGIQGQRFLAADGSWGEPILPMSSLVSRVETIMEGFAKCFDDLEDPRTGNAGRHDLLEILKISLCTVLSGGQTTVDMAIFGREKEPFLRDFLKLKHGPPSHDTFNRVFRLRRTS
jgi:hypothetical protein